MLVLTRKVGQTVTLEVAGGITIIVLGVEPGINGGEARVRLAFSAEKEIRILRGEARSTTTTGVDQAGADAGSGGEG